MAKGKFSINDEHLSPNQLRTAFSMAKQKHNLLTNGDLDLLFEIGLRNQTLFRTFDKSKCNNADSYFDQWVKSYLDSCNNPARKSIANPKKSCSDPAIALIVETAKGITSVTSNSYEAYHNLFMSAENIQGRLLEEYIASKVRPYGFLWCAGNVLHAVDFCNTDGTLLLQVKNKNNTENSSSKDVREGTQIKMWYRLKTKSVKKVPKPVFNWDSLNTCINDAATEGQHLPPCNMSENDYQAFLRKVVRANCDIITDR